CARSRRAIPCAMSAAPSGASAAVIRVEGLVKHFPIAHSRAFVAAVNGVSFEIARGETLGLVGESGSGKTTVARCIMNLESSTAGKIVFEGQEISGVPAKEARLLRRQVQLVFQEPFDSLDPRARRQIIDLLVELQAELGMSYLFITHDLNTLRHISHRIAVMYLGLIVEEGPTAAIFEEQRHPYTRALLSSVLYPNPETRRARFELRGEIPSPIDLPLGCYLASRCPLVMDECRAAIPPLVTVGDGRTSACIRHELVPTAAEAGTAAV